MISFVVSQVNMFKDNGEVIHFTNPKVQASLGSNTFAISGPSDTKCKIVLLSLRCHIVECFQLYKICYRPSCHKWACQLKVLLQVELINKQVMVKVEQPMNKQVMMKYPVCIRRVGKTSCAYFDRFLRLDLVENFDDVSNTK